MWCFLTLRFQADGGLCISRCADIPETLQMSPAWLSLYSGHALPPRMSGGVKRRNFSLPKTKMFLEESLITYSSNENTDSVYFKWQAAVCATDTCWATSMGTKWSSSEWRKSMGLLIFFKLQNNRAISNHSIFLVITFLAY